jgi:NTE family protein
MDLPQPTATIGIALSGGGSRAMAFHLGCLRALDRLGLLPNATLMVTVSGGSVIGAMHATRKGSFAAFEADARAVLARGFLWPAVVTALTTLEGLRAVAAFLLLAVVAILRLPLRLIGLLASLVGYARLPGEPKRQRPGLTMRRFASRTTILRRTFDRLLFGGRTLGQLRGDGPRLVVVATELQTATAFYFSQSGVTNYRLGRAEAADIPLAQAVAASAAFPLLLPALDETMTFSKSAVLTHERVTLTDGGVYDNLGLSFLWPDRDPAISPDVERVRYIIACRAGYGSRRNAAQLFFGARMEAVFGTIHSRAQNAAMNRLFDLKSAGMLAGFALPYLDQDDARLKFPPRGLVSRTRVADYPTDFSGMPSAWIDALSARGEQLTLAVIREHLPELVPPNFSFDAD